MRGLEFKNSFCGDQKNLVSRRQYLFCNFVKNQFQRNCKKVPTICVNVTAVNLRLIYAPMTSEIAHLKQSFEILQGLIRCRRKIMKRTAE